MRKASGLSQRKRYLSRIANAAESIHIRAPELTLLAVTGSLRQSTSTVLLEQGTQTPSPAPDLIPAQNERQNRKTLIRIGTANGGTSRERG